MKTKREVISRLRQDLREHSADTLMTSRYLWSAFWDNARVLIQREHDANKFKEQTLFQTYQLDTEDINPFEGTCVPLDCISCRAKIPDIMMSKSGPIYIFLGSPDFSTKYALVNPIEFEIKSKIKGTSQRYAYIDTGYIYLSKCLPCITLKAFPNDSVAAAACGVLDTSASVPDYLYEPAISMTISVISKSLGKPYDHVANKNEQN